MVDRTSGESEQSLYEQSFGKGGSEEQASEKKPANDAPRGCNHSLEVEGKNLILVRLHGKPVAYGLYAPCATSKRSRGTSTFRTWSKLSQTPAVGIPLQPLISLDQAEAELRCGLSKSGRDRGLDYLLEERPITVQVFAKLRHSCSARECSYAQETLLTRRPFEFAQSSASKPMKDLDFYLRWDGSHSGGLNSWIQLPGVLRKDSCYPQVLNGDETNGNLHFDTRCEHCWTFFWDLFEG